MKSILSLMIIAMGVSSFASQTSIRNKSGELVPLQRCDIVNFTKLDCANDNITGKYKCTVEGKIQAVVDEVLSGGRAVLRAPVDTINRGSASAFFTIASKDEVAAMVLVEKGQNTECEIGKLDVRSIISYK